MRILVIGGTNFIGPRVVRGLVEWGHEVVVYHRGKTEAELPDSVGHIRSHSASMPIVAYPQETTEFAPAVVVHMIPMGEADAAAAMQAFRGVARRIVGVSSGDVYHAYGVFHALEPGPIEPMPLTEKSPLRSVLYPYRSKAPSPDSLEHNYDKILAERTLLGDAELPGTILRLPKVYGPANGHGLEHYYQFRNHDKWRWTHGYVENVAHAICLAATHPKAEGLVFNVGEEVTPTVKERLRVLPPSSREVGDQQILNFNQDLVYDTSRIRKTLGYSEIVPYEDGIRRTLALSPVEFPPLDDETLNRLADEQFKALDEEEAAADQQGAGL